MAVKQSLSRKARRLEEESSETDKAGKASGGRAGSTTGGDGSGGGLASRAGSGGDNGGRGLGDHRDDGGAVAVDWGNGGASGGSTGNEVSISVSCINV